MQLTKSAHREYTDTEALYTTHTSTNSAEGPLRHIYSNPAALDVHSSCSVESEQITYQSYNSHSHETMNCCPL